MARVLDPPHDTAPREQRLAMSYDEYLAWFGEGRIGEWVDGEVIVFAMPNDRHQLLQSWLTTLLTLFVSMKKLGAVWAAPFEVRLRAGSPARIPDIVFLATEHFDRRDGERISGPVDLAVEIVSPDSVTRDRRDKFAQYAEWGIPEYWLLDPRPRSQSFRPHALTGEGIYELIEADDQGRVWSNVLPGLWLNPAWLWEADLLDPAGVLMEIDPENYDAWQAELRAARERRRASKEG